MTSNKAPDCYDVVLYQYFTRSGESKFCAQLMHRIRLPFKPSAGDSIGLTDKSAIGWDEDKIHRVMWQHSRREFLVELEPCRSGRESAKIAIAQGWCLALGVPFATQEEAEVATDGYTVVSIGGWWYTLSDDEMWCLKLDGREYTT